MRPRHIRFVIYTLMVAVATLVANAANAAQPVAQWVASFKQEAASQGISSSLLDRAFAGFTPSERILTLDRAQPESTLTFRQYLSRTVTPQRVAKGKQLYQQHFDLLWKIGRAYGVHPRFIVALWGKETDYGGFSGGTNVIHALATLAYDGRRADFFRKELLNALMIVQQGHIPLEKMVGSWAGAMGQCQFMPSSFNRYAVDYDRDGKRDIWNNKADIFASIANYLKTEGWNDDLTWGRAVQIPATFQSSLENIDTFRPLSEWAGYGVRNLDGSALPQKPLEAALIFQKTPSEGVFLIYRNFHVLLHWNRSRYFAAAVGTLADRIVGR